MDPVSLSAAASAILGLVDWKKVIQGLAGDAACKGAKGLLGRLQPNERDKVAKLAIGLFVEEFLGELEDKTPLTSAVAGYRDQLKRLIENAAPDIAGWMQPETKDVDLEPVERMWNGLGLDPLPEDFDWTLVAKSYARDIRRHVKSDPALRGMLDTALLEQQTALQQQSAAALARIAGPDPGFDLTGYRDFLRKKCGLLQLSAMHTSTSTVASTCGVSSFRNPPASPLRCATSRARSYAGFARKATWRMNGTILKSSGCEKAIKVALSVRCSAFSRATA